MQRWYCLLGCLFGLVGTAGAQAYPAHRLVERGKASWYAAPYSGKEAANGQIYDPNQLTAAHRTLPFGTRVRVQRLDSRRSVIVSINDRGPYVPSVIVDLSRAAAAALGMVHRGVAPVTLEILQTPTQELRSALTLDLRLAEESRADLSLMGRTGVNVRDDAD